MRYVRGPQVIKSEDTFLVKHILLEKKEEYSAVEMVRSLEQLIQEHVKKGILSVPEGVFYKFAGTYENEVRAQRRLPITVLLTLLIVLTVLYLRFRSLAVSGIIFSGALLSFAGGFLMLWFHEQHLGELLSLFHLHTPHTAHLSVASMGGFIALFGIATDNGVLMATYILQQLREKKNQHTPKERIIQAATARFRPAVMTTATTLIALLPILISVGKGASLMIPMAIPLLGGMLANLLSCFVVPLLFSLKEK